MSVYKDITKKQCMEVLLWIKVINDYSDNAFEEDDFSSKLANFLENYSERDMEMEVDTFILGLKKMVSLKLLEYDEENRAYEITEHCTTVVDALAKAELFTDKTIYAIKTGALTVGKIVKENIDKIDITLVKFEIHL